MSLLGEDKELESLKEVEVELKEVELKEVVKVDELMGPLHSRRTNDPLVLIFTHTF